MSARERKHSGYFGPCEGGPMNGVRLVHDSPRYALEAEGVPHYVIGSQAPLAYVETTPAGEYVHNRDPANPMWTWLAK